ncbi:glycosyltransferase family 4 protein [Oceanicola sp. 22II-s10i]|uniref:glycosyltransferase family 4 protein n=1 Tax=Oceanicola sp. 22II-s10i TaxID=1317116 RepID=UPI000B5259D9|nr:glycosyltransferase [Oceanicola sp. 22II-s10i]
MTQVRATRTPKRAEDRLRIVILNDSSQADGGTAALALLSARLLREQGHQVTYICGDEGDDGALEAQGITLVSCGGRRLLDQSRASAMRDGIYNKAIRDRLARDITAHDTPDTIYHLHGWAGILSPSVFDALKPVAERTYVHAHDVFLACPNGVYYDFPREEICHRVPMSAACLVTNCDKRAYHHKLWRGMRQRALHQAFDTSLPWAGVITLHPDMAEPLSRGGVPERLMNVVRNPAEPFSDTRIEAENNRTFGFIGRVDAGKGVRTLCQAARLANVPLKVIGDGAERADLAREFPEVKFTGWLAPEAIGERLKDVRALVMPSRFPEPFGLVAAEGSRSGLPVLISDAALLAREIEELGLGFKADVRTPEALSVVLRAMAAMPDDDVREISLRGFTGAAAISQTHAGWTDSLVGLYRAARPAIVRADAPVAEFSI